jgi:hypothetical protein
MKLQNLVALGVLAGALLGAPGAHAFKILTCGGKTVEWSGTAKMTRGQCSVPNGSTQATSYFSAIDRWNEVRGATDKLAAAFTWPPGHCFIDLDDGINDFALVDAADIDGHLGVSFVWRDCPEIHGIDILVANKNTQSFENPNESFAVGLGSPSGRFVVLHEFGHGQGLSLPTKGVDNHVSGFAVMRGSRGPLVGGLGQQHARPLPDDAKGLRFLYPNGNSEVNLMASAQRLNDTSIVNNTPTVTFTLCRGSSVALDWTMANPGTAQATVDNRFFLHPSDSAHDQTGVTLATWFNATVNPENVVFPTVTLKIPCGTTSGTYFLYHQVDSSHELDEWNEDDNVVRHAVKVKINNCGC